ncbi:O-antigen ligase family protein [Paracoccus ravus]|uniref:O-antigen ligase family protein n=1 Tax=Paracoccus ravus TaxID=2447760 RepID=UPI00106ED663|nr:O-antigen ligase family protein [Paracoccus ravus]
MLSLEHRASPHAVRNPGLWAVPFSLPALLAFLSILGLGLQPVMGSLGALIFLIAGAALVVTGPDACIRGLRQEGVLVALAAWCLGSFTWSDYPELSLRYGLQLTLTFLVAITICQRIPPGTFVRILLLVLLLAAALSLASGRSREGGMGFLGIYGSKNALAMTMGAFFLVSLAVAVGRAENRFWRAVALIGSGMGLALLVMGKSAGALVAVIVATAFLIPLMLLRRIDATSRLVLASLTLVLLASVGLALSSEADSFATAFLSLTGKDVTLTGRTELWLVAFEEIARHPLIGTGFQAFWVHGNPLAEDLWARFGIASRAGFNFHNTMISNAVEIGLVGATLQAVAFFSGALAALYWVFRSHSAAAVFFALFMVRQTISMGVEVVFFFQFDLTGVVTIAAICYARAFRRACRASAPRGRSAAPAPCAG